MIEYVYRILLLWTLLLAGQQLFAQSSESLPIVSVVPNQSYSLNSHLFVLLDSSKSLDWDGISHVQDWTAYGPVSNQLSPQTIVWGMLRLRNRTKDTTEWALELGKIDLVEIRSTAFSGSKRAGTRELVHLRDVKVGRKASIHLALPPQESVNIWIRMESCDRSSPLPRLHLIPWGRLAHPDPPARMA